MQRYTQDRKESAMLIPTIPFEYAMLIDTTDRVRSTRIRPSGSRVRRAATRGGELQ